MTYKLIIVCLSWLLFSLFSGCRKEDPNFCGYKVKLEIRAIWPDNTKKPEGIRVAIYPKENDSYVVDNFPSDGGEMFINRGSYAFLIHNNDNAVVRLRNIKKYETYEAYTQKADAPSYKPIKADEDMLEQPDELWVLNIDRYDILKSQVLTVYPKQIVFKYVFRLRHIKGMENIKAIRGSISGMMGSYFLNSSIVPTKPYTLFFENGTIENGINFEIFGFGVIDHTLEDGLVKKRDHILTVEFMNKSEVRRYNIDVTDKLDAIPLGGEIIIDNDIEVPPGEDVDGGGFNPDVGDWDNVIVPLG